MICPCERDWLCLQSNSSWRLTNSYTGCYSMVLSKGILAVYMANEGNMPEEKQGLLPP